MVTREFHFSEGTSNKFWRITVNGVTQTIHYGRIGTEGQELIKTFASNTEANTASDKLIAEKVKKGYVEVGVDSPTPPAQTPKLAATRQQVTKVETTPPPSSDPLYFERSIDLAPSDYIRVGALPRKPKKKPAVVAFDIEACIDRLCGTSFTWRGWDFGPAKISPNLSPQEAEFWLRAMMAMLGRRQSLQGVVAELRQRTYPGTIEPPVRAVLNNPKVSFQPEIVLPLAALLHVTEIVDIIVARSTIQERTPVSLLSDGSQNVVEGFEEYLLPYLTDDEFAAAADRLKATVFESEETLGRSGIQVFYLAGLLGLRSELATVFESWFAYDRGVHDYTIGYERGRKIALMIGPGDYFDRHLRRSTFRLSDQDDVRAWLAITQYEALDTITASVVDHRYKEGAEKIARGLARVRAPEAAPHMLRILLKSEAVRVAQEWFNANPVCSIVGLLPIAAGDEEMSTDAARVIAGLSRRGHGAAIEAALATVSDAAAARLRLIVLPELDTDEIEEIDSVDVPADLKASMSRRPELRPGDANPSDFPAIVLPTPNGMRKLSIEYVVNLFGSLRKSTLDKPAPFVEALKVAAEPESLDRFAWALLQHWIKTGAPVKEKWQYYALGLLGGDASANKLLPLLNEWRMNGFATRAQQGLECLRAIGTDNALMIISNISQRAEFKSLKKAALDCMDRIAQSRGFTKPELEDRIVPTCGLEANGGRTITFGDRTFRFSLSPEMKPVLRDETGKAVSDLPKPSAKVDQAVAAKAADEWKLLKKQVAQAVKVQSARLEQAMVTGRRWKQSDFQTLLVRHPLMTNLVQSILWMALDPETGARTYFRVTEDQTLADVDDITLDLAPTATVTVAHPLLMSDHEKAIWGERWSDYELIPPFPQLGRPVYRLEAGEAECDNLERFCDKPIPAPSVVFTLDKRGWDRLPVEDGGVFCEHIKPFYGANVTAVISYQPGVMAGMVAQSPDQKLAHCYWLDGFAKPSEVWTNSEKKLNWGDIDPVVVSEVLADLTWIVENAK